MKVEAKVGMLFLGSIGLVVAFAYMMGSLNLFENSHELNVLYNFAGGIDVGSPVRVMGIKVGKVKSITFDPTQKDSKGEEVKLRIVISVDKKAWTTIREDSQFYINLAGVIGEKFLEITPGNLSAKEFVPGASVRGEDPPRVDQLISQGYGLAGKMLSMVEKNEGSVSNLIRELDHLVTNFNKTLVLLDRTTKNPDIAKLMSNTLKMSDDLVYLTHSLRSEKSEKTVELLQKLLFRLEDLDGPAIRKFLQQEGVKAKIF